MNFTVNEELKNLIPPLTKEEFRQLEDNIFNDGIRDALVIGEYLDNERTIRVLIDGHNRLEIANTSEMPYNTKTIKFKGYLAIKEWMITHQFGRRNLNNYQRSTLALQLEHVYSERAKQSQARKPNFVSHNCDEQKEPVSTKKELSKIANVSHNTIARVKKLEEKATPEIKEQLRSGEMSINQAYKEVRKVEKNELFIKNKESFNKKINTSTIKKVLFNGDCNDFIKTLDDKSIDCLLTDPPYAMNFKSGWSSQKKIKNDLFSETVELIDQSISNVLPKLKDDAHCYIFSNMRYIEEIQRVIKKHLKIKNILIWDRKVIGMGDLKTYGYSYDIVFFCCKYDSEFKPLNGTRDRDILQFNRVVPTSADHPTPKPIDMLEYLIKKSSNEKDNILDLFLGGGNIIQACENTNRNILGSELDKEYFDKFIKGYENGI